MLTQEEKREMLYEEIETAFNDYDLTGEQIRSYASRLVGKKKPGSVEKLYERFIDYIDALKELGVDEIEAVEMAKNNLPYLGPEYRAALCFAKVLNSMDYVSKNPMCIMVSINRTHALKMYGKENGIQITRSMIYTGHKYTRNKNGDIIEQAMIDYPLAEETIGVIKHFAHLTPKELKTQYGLTNDELAEIYPTTKEELLILRRVANMTHEEVEAQYGLPKEKLRRMYPLTNDALKGLEKTVINNRLRNIKDETVREFYGISKQSLMAKEPLTHDTLIALITVKNMEDYNVEIMFGETKEEVLARRSLSTEDIANSSAKPKVTNRSELAKVLHRAIIKKSGK